MTRLDQNKVDEFLKITSIKLWKNKIKFNGLEFEGDINHYTLVFINGAWFIFNEEHKNEINKNTA